VDGVCIGLCAGADVGTDEAEKYIPRNTCALIKAFMGFKLAGLCPYIQTTDLIVGETTCDGKKKAYEIFDEITKKVYVMELPSMKREDGKRLWENEIRRFAAKLEEISGKKITLEKLKESSKIVNNKRKALQRLSSLRAADPSPISGLDALLVNQVSFYDDPVRFTAKVNELCDEIEGRVKSGDGVSTKGSRRLLISGSPMAIPNWKLHAIIEGIGATVVGEESCVGERNFRTLLNDNFSSVEEALHNLAERYMTIDCACFTPNNERMTNIVDMTKKLKAHGVIHYALQFCTPYMVEAHRAKNAVEKAGIPFIKIETDYSMEDMGQLKTRVEAFLEMIKRE
jgi:benzoyl-CoA reductase/2-hydroxyglutaryl-CoA dehydratase subunit BcrC/BadD/HgdB